MASPLTFDDLTPQSYPNVDTLLPMVRTAENSGDAAVSPKGAVGRYQIMPGTARQYGFDPSMLSDPDYNEGVARTILGDLNTRYKGNPAAILAAYNAGPGRADKFVGSGFNTATLPPETRRYLATGLAASPQPQAQPVDFGDLIPRDKSGAVSFDDVTPTGKSPQGKPSAPFPDPGLLGALSSGLYTGMRDIGQTINLAESKLPGWARFGLEVGTRVAATNPIQGVSPLGTAAALHNQATHTANLPPLPPSTASQPLTLSGGFDPGSVAEKTLYGLGESAPVLAGGAAAGIPGAAVMAAGQSAGPSYERQLAATPKDVTGATERAALDTAIDTAATAAGWKLFEFTPFKSTVRNLVLQGVGVQPAVAMVTQAAHNSVSGRPIGEGVPDQYMQGILPNFIGLGLAHGLHTMGGGAEPGEAVAPESQPENMTRDIISTPSNAPQEGAPIGLKFPNAPSRRATVDTYFDNGNAVRLRFDDGSVRDYLTSEVMRDVTAPPPPMGETPAPTLTGSPLTQEERQAAPFPEPEDFPQSPRALIRRTNALSQPTLGGDALKALDQAHTMEREAVNPASNMPYEVRRDMLTQAAALRRQFGIGPEGDVSIPPEAYQHPLANEPAAPIGELAIPRATRPDLYEGPRAVPIPETAPPQVTAPRPPEAEDADYAATLSDVRDARSTASAGPDLLSTIIKMGGIKIKDAAGNVTPEGQTIRQVLGDKYRPGLVNNKTGITPDYLREALTERGWFGDRDLGQTTLQPLYDALDQSSRGQKVYHSESDAQSVADRRSLIQEEMARAGVSASDSHAVAAQKLMDFRRSDIENMIAEHEAQANAETQNLSPEAYGHLIDYGYEPGADIGAEHEAGEGAQEPQGAPEPHEASEPAAGGPQGGEVGAQEAEGRREPAPALAQPVALRTQFQAGRPPEQTEFATEPGAVDAKGNPLPQTIIPGAEASAHQLAAAREAQGRGRKVAKAEQKEAGPLFAPGEGAAGGKQGTLFQKAAPRVGANALKGERVKLSDDLVGRTLGEVSPKEADVLNAVEAEAKRIVPQAKVSATRSLEARPDFAKQAGIKTGTPISGATYSNGLRRAIAWSLESPDAVGTLRHEAVHYLRGRGLISPDEWAALDREAASKDWIAKHDIAARYPDLAPEHQTEEAVAEEFSKWQRAPSESKLPPIVRNAFERIAQFLHAVGGRIRQMLGRDVMADDVFRRMESGEVGARGYAPVLREEPSFAQAGRRVEEPETPEQGRDYLDNVSDAMAEDFRGKGPGTYARLANEKMQNAWKPGAEKVLGDLERRTIFPRTLASLDWRSARYYNAIKVRDEAAHHMQADYREFANGDGKFTSLPKDSQNKALSAMELLRLDNRAVENDGRSLVVRNEGHDLAALSRPGETIALSPAETKALFSLKDMFARQWSDLIAGTAKKLGWNGAPDPDAIRQAAEKPGLRGAEIRNLNHIADMVQALKEQERTGYIPLMRFGDYYMAVKPKVGVDKESAGGFPQVEWYSRVESRAPWEKLLGRPSFGPKKGIPDDAYKTVAGLNALGKFGEFELKNGKWESPTHTIEHGYVPRDPEALRKLDIPAVEKLMQALEHRSEGGEKSFQRNEAYKKLMDEIRDQMYEEMKAGFKKRSKATAGYSPDFRRAMGSYNFWMSSHVADMLHGDEIERGQTEVQKHPDANVREFWNKWDQYQEHRPGLLEKGSNALQNFAFYWTMAGVPAVAAHIMTHGPVIGLSSLTTGVPFGEARAALLGAAGDTLRNIQVDATKGLNYGDVSKIGRTPGEREFLGGLERDGELHSRMTDEFGRIKHGDSELATMARTGLGRVTDVVGSTVAAADRFTRIPLALAAYRLAERPGGFDRFAKAWGHDENFKSAIQKYGPTPEAVGRFMLSEGAFDYGKRNAPEFARGPYGQAMMQFHNFQLRALSKMLQLATRMGPEGKKAVGLMMLSLYALAGTQGLPFVQDLENAYDWVHEKLFHTDPNVKAEMRKWLEAHNPLGQLGADMVLRGPISTLLGVDLTSRLGFGDPISRMVQNFEVLGAAPSIVYNAVSKPIQRAETHQGAVSAASEAMPSAVKNVVQGTGVWPTQGVKSMKGRTIVPPQHITAADETRKALGWEPLDVARAYEQRENAYRAAHRHVP